MTVAVGAIRGVEPDSMTLAYRAGGGGVQPRSPGLADPALSAFSDSIRI
jgi:hypothetical protein